MAFIIYLQLALITLHCLDCRLDDPADSVDLLIMPPVNHLLALDDSKVKLVDRAEGASNFACETDFKSCLGSRFEGMSHVLLQKAQLAEEDFVLRAIEHDRLTLVLQANLRVCWIQAFR